MTRKGLTDCQWNEKHPKNVGAEWLMRLCVWERERVWELERKWKLQRERDKERDRERETERERDWDSEREREKWDGK